MTTESRALVPQRTALQVNDQEAAEFAGQLMKHAAAGGPLFPKEMTQSQAVQMARLSLAYGLDPIAGELILYQGRPYVTIDGRVRKAQESAAYDGLECVPATDAERQAFKCGDDEHLWVCRVWRKDRRFPFVGYGRSAGKSDRNPVSGTYPQEMAQKRAKSRALRDAFAMPLPSYEEDAPHPRASREPARYEQHDSGHVIEGESRVIDADPDTGELPATDDNRVTGSQVTAIHTLVRLMKLEDSEYRAFLGATFGVESSTQLTEGQASAFIEALSAVLESAQEEGRRARIDDVVARINKSVAAFNDTRDEDPTDRRQQQAAVAEPMEPTSAAIGAEPPTAELGDPVDTTKEHWWATWKSAIAGTEFAESTRTAAFLQGFTESLYPDNGAMWVADIDDFLDYATEEDCNRLIAAIESAKAPARRAAQAQRVHGKVDQGDKAPAETVEWIRNRLESAAPEIMAQVGTIDYAALTRTRAAEIKALLDGKAQ